MMPQCDFGRAQLAGNAVQYAAAQARAETAGGFAFRNDAFHHAIGILLDNAKWHVDSGEVFRQHVLRETRLFLIQIYRDEFKPRLAHAPADYAGYRARRSYPCRPRDTPLPGPPPRSY